MIQGNVVKQGVVTYPAIGIRFSPIETIEERNKLKDIGIVLGKVQETPEDGAAYEAGMMPGDVIVLSWRKRNIHFH